ncbi:MAG: alpha/beta hydrolase, partial [Deltaproteobacteria bacterium]|nr:alpha/beta hydrolase [Deltaproteobacteria bacterium]
GFREEYGFRNLEKMRTWDKPALVIHAEFDHLIPFSDGQALFDACPSSDKTLLKIPGANHNDIFMRGLEAYMKAVKTLCERRAT